MKGKTGSKNGIYLVIDSSNSQNGITDRLKTAVGLCWIARQNGVGFRFIHRAGFDIRDYLLPNKVPWSAELSDITRLPWKKQPIEYMQPYTGLPEFRPDRQYICRKYDGKNLIEMSNIPDWERVWRELFWEMFMPSERVKAALAGSVLPERYIAVNARFVNALGHNETADYNSPFPEEIQARLIAKVLEKAAACEKEAGLPAIIYSDSVTFLKAAAGQGFRTCDPDGVGHIMNSGVSENVILRTFVFLFQMSRAEKIYSVLNLEGVPANSLYKSQYPRYAAIIGDKPLLRL